MSLKLLIADDSLTIQKVIKIALANEDFDISVCENDHDLLNTLNVEQPKIVLLDFNLSQEKSGIDLAKEILNFDSDIQILMLYTTFDIIDEDSLSQVGVANKIVKPFDGNEFISKCRKLRAVAEQSHEFVESTPNDYLHDLEEESEEDSSDGWVMNIPEVMEEKKESKFQTSIAKGKLQEGLEEWGINVPGVIGEASDAIEIPDIILSNNLSEIAYPSTEDLEYPDMDDLMEASSKLISIDDLNINQDSEEEIDIENTTEFLVEEISDELHVKNLEDQINDEVEEIDLWAADEEEDFSNYNEDISLDNMNDDDLPMVDEQKLHEVMINSPDLSHLLHKNDHLDLNLSEDLREKIKNDLSPMIEKYIKEYCNEHIERIAWEVIPDLAENLIKKEIRKISESVFNSQI